MSKREILERAIQKAIGGGWKPVGRGTFKYVYSDSITDELFAYWQDEDMPYCYSIASLVHNHDFARALWKDSKAPESEEIDDVSESLGLYRAEGGGGDGFGDYVILSFDGEPWQYHLQQMVIADDPIKYVGESL